MSNQVFKLNLVQIQTQIRVYRTSSRSVLTWGSEAWAVYKRYEGSVRAEKINCVRRHSFEL